MVKRYVISKYLDVFSNYLDTNIDKVLLITDESIEFDNRVQAQILALNELGLYPEIIHTNVSYSSSVKRRRWLLFQFLFNNIFVIIKSLLYYIKFVLKNKIKLRLFPRNLNGVLNDLYCFDLLEPKRNHYTLVIANNQKSLNYFNKHCTAKYVVFDSHEIEVFRNRSEVSHLRSFLNLIKFKNQISCVSHCVLISSDYHRILSELIGTSKIQKFSIVYNNHYKAFDASVRYNNVLNGNIVLLYFGYVVESRGIEAILSFQKDLPHSSLYFFSCGIADKYLDLDRSNVYLFEDFPYQPNLQNILEKHEKDYIYSLVFHDAKNFSYQQALPNKFFQSLAARTPIICFDGTYVSQIVRKYDLGIVIPRHIISDIKEINHYYENLLDRSRYSCMIKNMINFEDCLDDWLI